MESFRQICGNEGSYETDFFYTCAFVSSFWKALKSPQWTFIGLRQALEYRKHDAILRDIMRRAFTLGGRTIIGGVDDEADTKMDRAILRLITDREFEWSVLFLDRKPAIEQGFITLPVEDKARLVRFILQCVFETPQNAMTSDENSILRPIGIDSEGDRYYTLTDTSLEVGCWKETGASGNFELVATTTDALVSLAAGLKTLDDTANRTTSTCSYCRKKVSGKSLKCGACASGTCHYECLPPAELLDVSWNCSSRCYQIKLANELEALVQDIEPQQKAAMRKRRRLAHEISSLDISAKDGSGLGTRSTRSKSLGTVDYSFRDYDKFISQAIRRSERRAASSGSDEEPQQKVRERPLTREERMALREHRSSDDGGESESPHYAMDAPVPVVSDPHLYEPITVNSDDMIPEVVEYGDDGEYAQNEPTDESKLHSELPQESTIHEPLHYPTIE